MEPFGPNWSSLTARVVLLGRRGQPHVVPVKPSVPEVLRSGPFTSDEASAVGVTRGKVRGASYRPLGSGLYRWVGRKDSQHLMLTPLRPRLPRSAPFSCPTA